MNSGGSTKSDPSQRLFDCVCAAAGLVVLSPVLIGIGALIAAFDGTPVLFRQVRVGRNGRPFHILKFRTMRAGSTGSSITSSGDERITPIGAVLRKYKLDELPQLVNVLVGEMSLVGPRPEVPEYVRLDSPAWQAILQARPGITDLASLVYRNEEDLLRLVPEPETYYRNHLRPRKLALNLTYLSTRNLGRDLRLILASIRYSLVPGQFDPEFVYRKFVPGGHCEPHVHSLSCSIDR
jgi:lipopolysaccharide/colanic/teichoic acid biosynthesis glycosyltransferase